MYVRSLIEENANLFLSWRNVGAFFLWYSIFLWKYAFSMKHSFIAFLDSCLNYLVSRTYILRKKVQWQVKVTLINEKGCFWNYSLVIIWQQHIVWKVSKCEAVSGPYLFGLNTEISVFSPNTGKYGSEIIPYLDTFHAVTFP